MAAAAESFKAQEYIERDARNALVISTGAAGVALSVGIGAMYIFVMPQGGAISLEMFPIVLIAYAFGARCGTAAGALVGFLNMLVDPYIVGPVQAALDYPLAYGCLGLAGLRRWPRAAVTAAAFSLRAFCHILSGVLYFSEYVPEGMSPISYSIDYNVSFILPSAVIASILAAVAIEAARSIRARFTSSI